MKNFKFIPLLFIAVILLIYGCTKSTGINITPQLDSAVSSAILEDNKASFYEGECQAEGHIIFKAKEKGDEIIAYTYVGYREYGFENGNFVDISGMNAPAVIRLDKEYKLIDIKYPEDGDNYQSSIRKMFPTSCVKKALHVSSKNEESVNKQLEKYARDYLKSINRDAPVGTMSDFDYPLLTELGVSVDVSNSLGDIERTLPYPYWVGNKEVIENNTRYVYQMDYDKKANIIIYTKYEYENNDKIAEQFKIDAANGKIVK